MDTTIIIAWDITWSSKYLIYLALIINFNNYRVGQKQTTFKNFETRVYIDTK